MRARLRAQKKDKDKKKRAFLQCYRMMKIAKKNRIFSLIFTAAQRARNRAHAHMVCANGFSSPDQGDTF